MVRVKEAKMARVLEGVASRTEGAPTASSTTTTRVEQAAGAVGERIDALAETIRERAPREGGLGTAAIAVAERLESSAKYLRGNHLQDMGRDLTDTIRRYPAQALLLALGLGYMLTRRFR